MAAPAHGVTQAVRVGGAHPCGGACGARASRGLAENEGATPVVM